MTGDPARLLLLRQLFDEGIDLPAEARARWLETVDASYREELSHLFLASSDATLDGAPSVGSSFATALPGQRIGPYHIVRLIGQGGMGAVYEAVRRDDQYEKRVAIKLVQRGLDSELTLARFRRERQILANLEHRNIATLLDGGVTEEGRPFFVMEYVEGEAITTWCDCRKLPIAERIGLLRQVCSAVQHAHRNLVIHRDIKPGNILVTADGTVKLLDFGIAKLLGNEGDDAALPLTRGDGRAFTPEYASPEQWRNEPLTTASDIYSLGVIAFELLAGRRPFITQGLGLAALEREVLEGAAPKASTLVTDAAATERCERNAERLRRRLQGELDDVLLTALHAKPQARYESAEALGEDFRRHLLGLPLQARRDWTGYRFRKFVRRHRAVVVASTLAVLALIVGVITTATQAARARQESERTAQVNQFLSSILSSVSTETGGRDVPVSELLDSAAVRLATELADKPAVRAPLERVIGGSYRQLGILDVAERHLLVALQLERELTGAKSPESFAAMHNLGELYNAMGTYARADSMLTSALAGHRAASRQDDTLTAMILSTLGSVANNAGHPKVAEGYHREALKLYQALLPQSDDRIPAGMNNLAVAYGYQENWAVAESLHRAALSALIREHPETTTNVANAMDALASALDIQGKQEAAESAYAATLAMRRKLLGPRHPDYAWTVVNNAMRVFELQRVDEAERYSREVLALRGNGIGEGHPTIAAALQTLGRCLDAKGDHAGAEAALVESLELRRKYLGPTSWMVASSGRFLGDHYRLTKQYPQAERVLLTADSVMRKALGDSAPRTIMIAKSLLALYQEWGHQAQAAAQQARIPPDKP